MTLQIKNYLFELILKQIVQIHKKMADKRRTAFSLQENSELAETVRTFSCLYDKSKKEYKGKNVVQNAWKEVADQLDFIENSKFFILNEV